MLKYGRLGVKIAIDFFPYQELQDLLKLWGRSWLIAGEKRCPTIEEIKDALKQAIFYYYSRGSNDVRIQLEKLGNDGWKNFNITSNARFPDETGAHVDRRPVICITYKVSRGRSWTGCGKNLKPHMKLPGIIYFRVFKDGKIKRR